MKELFDLFITFAKMGAITFGGGYAMLPIIQKEVVEKKKWATNDEVVDYYAVGQCTPGVIAVNTATFIGYKLRGIFGAIAATFGVVFPSLVIIMTIATFLSNFADLEIVKHAFGGIRVAVVALIISSVIKLWKSSVNNYVGMIIAVAAFIFGGILKISPVYIVIAAGIVGILTKQKSKGGNK
ncbi:MAG: chromate transporter [Clostridium butyricum]|nr:chromate transporter [Clostridium butyricum]